ncbi:MAG: hypothetical protein KAH31_11080 [Candidatus Sabulitectum sp.]|nr:hypothetical protein [Candidatus Sabulitectum sp.]
MRCLYAIASALFLIVACVNSKEDGIAAPVDGNEETVANLEQGNLVEWKEYFGSSDNGLWEDSPEHFLVYSNSA